MRMFLRIEFLHNEAMLHAEHEAASSTRAAISSLLEILAITSRGDIRADALKELDRHMLRLSHFRQTPGIDSDRLDRLVADVDRNRQALSAAGKQFLAPLRENDFLNAVRHRSSIPGGTCNFDLPDYGYWLNLPGEERLEQLQSWLVLLQPLCDAIDQILWLTREASTPSEQVAPQGLYNQNLGKGDSYDLIRVFVTQEAGLYPEISAGHHRFTVRFAEWRGADNRSRQTTEDVSFLLALC
jgi:cell division protein ZapD